MGTPDYASTILETLLKTDNIDIVAVYTQPDKPVGRKKILTPSPVKVLAKEHNIALHQPQRLRDEDVVAELKNIQCDFIVVAAYGQILPLAVLEHAPCINLHASILPQYRGASPIQQTLLSGDMKSGVTAMLMDEGLDTGAILKISQIDVDDDEMLTSLFEKLTRCASALSIAVLRDYDALIPVAQNDAEASYCKKISKENGEVIFDNARNLYNKYRAYTPWPGVYLKSGLKLKQMTFEEGDSSNKAGVILSYDKESALIGCERGSIRLYSVQPPSKKEISMFDYINGKRLSLEDILL
jgi:methionyl-tRNA formyltransferase